MVMSTSVREGQSVPDRTMRQPQKEHRLNVRISGSAYDELQKLAEEQGTTMSNVMRSAIALERWYRRNLKEGGRVLVERNGTTRELIDLG